jgi:hypothetical protein
VNLDEFLDSIKQELDEMGEPEAPHHDIDCGHSDCFLCQYHDGLPVDEALIGAFFLGHDLALASSELRFHGFSKHFCAIHIRLFYDAMKATKRESFGK